MYIQRFSLDDYGLMFTYKLEFDDIGCTGKPISDSPIPFPVRITAFDMYVKIVVNDCHNILVYKGPGHMFTSNLWSGLLNVNDMIDVVNTYIRNHVVIMPINDKVFRICEDDRDVSIEKNSNGYFFFPQKPMFDICKRVLNYNRFDLIRKFNLSDRGQFPVSETIGRDYAILVSLNKGVAVSSSLGDLEHPVILGEQYSIRQGQNGLYYLSGDIENLYAAIGVRNRAEFIRFLKPVIGNDRVCGIFPEQKTREGVISIIKFILRCMQ